MIQAMMSTIIQLLSLFCGCLQAQMFLTDSDVDGA
jgi:hypothetical protein